MIDTVLIGPIPYTITEVEKLIGPDADGNNTYLNGRVKYEKALIEIEKELPPEVKAAALLHEVIHAILEQAGIEDEPEPIVIALGYGLLDVIVNNPRMIDYLLQRADAQERIKKALDAEIQHRKTEA